MRKTALLSLAMALLCEPALSQTVQAPASVPNFITPGGTTPQMSAPSLTGGVPNPVTPLGIDPRTMLPSAELPAPTFGPANPNMTNQPELEPHLTPFGQAVVQNPIGLPHNLPTAGASGTATENAE
jgi:hypothetical protein